MRVTIAAVILLLSVSGGHAGSPPQSWRGSNPPRAEHLDSRGQYAIE